MYRTTGDLQYNPATNQWEPIGGVVAIAPAAVDPEAMIRHHAALAAAGFPVPAPPQQPEQLGTGASPAGLRWPPAPHPEVSSPGGQQTLTTEPRTELVPPAPAVSIGGTRHIIEGAGELVDDLEEENELLNVDRLAELEEPTPPKRDTERPPSRRRRN